MKLNKPIKLISNKKFCKDLGVDYLKKLTITNDFILIKQDIDLPCFLSGAEWRKNPLAGFGS